MEQVSISVWCVQCHYCTALFDRAVCTGSSILLQSLSVWYIQEHYYNVVCQSRVNKVITVLHSVSVRCVQGLYCTAFCVRAVCTGALGFCSPCQCCVYRVIYCSLCQCVMYSDIILLQSLSVLYVRGHYCTEFYVFALCTSSLLY